MALLRAKQGFSCRVKDTKYVFSGGQYVPDNHPAVKGRDDLFETVADVEARLVEQATASPTEKRGGKKPAAKSTAKKTTAKKK